MYCQIYAKALVDLDLQWSDKPYGWCSQSAAHTIFYALSFPQFAAMMHKVFLAMMLLIAGAWAQFNPTRKLS